MTVDEVYAELNRLTAVWERVEERLTGLPCELPGLRLTVSRFGSRMRLCFDGRPVHDCTTNEKIEAFDYFWDLLVARDGILDERGRKAKTVADDLERWLAAPAGSKPGQVPEFRQMVEDGR